MRLRFLGREIPVSRFAGLHLLTGTWVLELKPPRYVPV